MAGWKSSPARIEQAAEPNRTLLVGKAEAKPKAAAVTEVAILPRAQWQSAREREREGERERERERERQREREREIACFCV